MHIIRYAGANGPAVGVTADGGAVRPLAVPRLADLLALPLADIRTMVEATGPVAGNPLRTLAPVDGDTEVWASGVTYRRSNGRLREVLTARHPGDAASRAACVAAIPQGYPRCCRHY